MSATSSLIESAQLIAQGAEAKVYKTTIGDSPILIKYRFTKQYRNAALDALLTKQRVAGEARALLRCLRFGVSVPGVRFVHADTGVLGIEWIEGTSARKVLGGGAEGEDGIEEEEEIEDRPDIDELKDIYGLSQERMMTLIGEEIAKMHKSDIIHGDLTTSNMMLRRGTESQESKLVLIDFGLSYNSALVEDKAVDLYVLERAFASTHPGSEGMFGQVLQAYERVSGSAWKNVKRRLDDGAEVTRSEEEHGGVVKNWGAVGSLSRARNSELPINKLPSELLCRIFTICEEDERVFRWRGDAYFTVPEKATAVCHHWKNVAISDPSLWTYIHITHSPPPDGLVALYLSRAGSTTLLDIDIEICARYCSKEGLRISSCIQQLFLVDRLLGFLMNHGAGTHRWRSLLFAGKQPEVMCKMVSFLKGNPVPALRFLSLKRRVLPPLFRDEEDRCFQSLGLFPDALDQANMPSLTRADLHLVPGCLLFERPEPLFTGLTTLTLAVSTPFSTLVGLGTLLVANQRLESLSIDCMLIDSNIAVPESYFPQLRLPLLRSFSVGREGHPFSTLVVLWMIRVPDLQKFSLFKSVLPRAYDQTRVREVDVLRYLYTGKLPGKSGSADAVDAPIYKALQDLDISNIPINAEEISEHAEDFLCSFSSVTRLTISSNQIPVLHGNTKFLLPNLVCVRLTSYFHGVCEPLEKFLSLRADAGVPIQVVELPATEIGRAMPIFNEDLCGAVRVAPYYNTEKENEYTPSIDIYEALGLDVKREIDVVDEEEEDEEDEEEEDEEEDEEEEDEDEEEDEEDEEEDEDDGGSTSEEET